MKDYPHYNGWRDRNGHGVIEELSRPRRESIIPPRRVKPSIYRQAWNDIKWAWHEDRRQFVKIVVYATVSIGLLIMFLSGR